MVRISGGSSVEIDRDTTYTREPHPSDYINVDRVIDDNKAAFSTDDLNVSVNRTITSSTENETTTYHVHENVQITENHPPDYDPWDSSSDSSPPPSTSFRSKKSIWEIHHNKIDAVITRIAQNLLTTYNRLPYIQVRVCLGHDVVNCIIHDKNKRKRARTESETAIAAYSQLAEYGHLVSSSIGLEDKNKKFRFIFRVHHVNNHKNCENFEIQFIPRNPEDAINLSSTVKKCLGHVDYLYTFPLKTSANEALRNLSHNVLEQYKAKNEIKANGNLETHAFSREENGLIKNDLFIFYQHKDDHDPCDKYCFAPHFIDKLASNPPKKEEKESHSFYETSQERLNLAEKQAKLEDKISHLDQKLMPDCLESTKDFCLGYSDGFIEGVKDAGANWKHLAAEFGRHPLKTTNEILHILQELSNLVLSDQWSELSEALSPEAYKLATEWNDLSSKERGHLSGYAIGKGGADLFIPGAIAKLASKGVKGAHKLLEVSHSLQKVENTLALEAAALESGAELVHKPNITNLVGETAIPKIIFGEGNFTIEKLLEAGKSMDRQGLTKAGRGLAKHGGRNPTVFPKPVGNPAEINLQGQQILEKILSHPEKEVIFDNFPRYGNNIIVFSPEGGVRFDIDGNFIGFLEPR